MSGFAKQIIYKIIITIVWIAAGVAMVFFCYLQKDSPEIEIFVLLALVFVFLALFPLEILMHEFGHLLFGWIVRMKWMSVSIFHLSILRTGKRITWRFHINSDGACAMVPVGNRHLKARVIFYSLGGIIFNFAYGATALILYFLLPKNLVLTIFAALAPVSIAEGIAALLPFELSAGKTDGRMVLDLIKNEPSAMLALRVMQLQGELCRCSYDEIPRERFYDVPVVREDDYAYLSLLQLRFQYENYCGNRDEARTCLNRLLSLSEYLSSEEQREVTCEKQCFLFTQDGRTTAVREEESNYDSVMGKLAALINERYDEDRYEWLQKAIDGTPLKGLRAYEQRILERIVQIKKSSANDAEEGMPIG